MSVEVGGFGSDVMCGSGSMDLDQAESLRGSEAVL